MTRTDNGPRIAEATERVIEALLHESQAVVAYLSQVARKAVDRG